MSLLNLQNISELEQYFIDTISYFKELRDNDGAKLIDGPRKTFIPGFAVLSKSILAITKCLHNRNHNHFEYVLFLSLISTPSCNVLHKIISPLG